jgi:hypothetical protein
MSIENIISRAGSKREFVLMLSDEQSSASGRGHVPVCLLSLTICLEETSRPRARTARVRNRRCLS